MDRYSNRQWLTLVVFCIGQFCSALCISIQAPFYPKEAEEKGAKPSQYGFVFGVYELVMFVCSPIYGKFLNHIGVKLVNNMGIFTVGVTSILFGFLTKIQDTTAFIAFSFAIRMVEATGTAAFVTAALSILAKEFPQDVGATFALIETFFGIGLILGPTIGGALYEVGGFTLPFCAVGGLLLCSGLLILFVLPGQGEDASPPHNSNGILHLLRLPVILLGAAAVFGASFSIGFVQATLEPHLRPLGLSPLQLGLMFILNGATYALSAPLWGCLSDRCLSPQAVWATGAALISSGFLLIGPAPFMRLQMSLVLCVPALILHGLGMGAVLVSTFSGFHKDAIATGAFSDDISTYGLVSGLWTSTFALGAFVGPSLGGVLYDAIGFPWASQIVVILHFLIFLLTLAYLLFRKGKDFVIFRSRPGHAHATCLEQEPILAVENGANPNYGGINANQVA